MAAFGVAEVVAAYAAVFVLYVYFVDKAGGYGFHAVPAVYACVSFFSAFTVYVYVDAVFA